MKDVVVDASVAVKWFVPEIYTDAATVLLGGDHVLSAPDLIGPELVNTLWKKVRRGELTTGEAMEIVHAFPRLGVEIYPSDALLSAAFELAVALDRTVYDSLYLALAVARNAVLITADARFHASVAASLFADHVHWIAEA